MEYKLRFYVNDQPVELLVEPHLTLLEVDQGNALLIQTPEGRSLLIDGGSSPSQLSDALGRPEEADRHRRLARGT